jgi:hypothetical protein
MVRWVCLPRSSAPPLDALTAATTLWVPKRDLIVLASLPKRAAVFMVVHDELTLSDEAFHRIEKDQGV